MNKYILTFGVQGGKLQGAGSIFWDKVLSDGNCRGNGSGGSVHYSWEH
jgi:hypothetical protein